MTTDQGHLSSYELDRVALGLGPPEARSHSEGCDACGAYLARLRQPTAVPEWVEDLGRAPRRFRPPAWALALLGAAVTAGLVLVSPLRPPSVASKGAPSALLYVLRDGHVSRWDGEAPFRAGDAIRVEVTPEGFTHLTVLHDEGAGTSTLYEGELPPEGKALLPLSWTLDGAQGQERLWIVWSHGALAPELRARAVNLPLRDEQVWTTRLVLVVRQESKTP